MRGYRSASVFQSRAILPKHRNGQRRRMEPNGNVRQTFSHTMPPSRRGPARLAQDVLVWPLVSDGCWRNDGGTEVIRRRAFFRPFPVWLREPAVAQCKSICQLPSTTRQSRCSQETLHPFPITRRARKTAGFHRICDPLTHRGDHFDELRGPLN